MDLEKNKKTIMELILFTVIIVFACINISYIWTFIKYVIAILMPFIVGAMIAFVLNVLLNVVENKLFKKLNKKNSKVWKKIKRPVSLITTFIIIIAILALILGLIIPQLQNTVELFADNFSSYRKQSIEVLEKIGIDRSNINNLNESLKNIQEEVTNYVSENTDEIMQTTVGVASSVLGTITSLVLGIVFAIYILLKKEDLSRQFKKLAKAYLPEKRQKTIEEISKLSNKTFGNFVSGQCIEALIIGILCFIGMLILQIPYAPTIAVLVGFTALIPVFGAFIGTAIGAFLILMVDPGKAIVFIIFIIILQQLEGNLIYPKVVGNSVGLPGIWVMVAVTVGASIAGILGMLLSVPICSILYSILKTDVNNKIDKKNKQPLTINQKEKRETKKI